jgi:RND family efflux transporter MFP subunit
MENVSELELDPKDVPYLPDAPETEAAKTRWGARRILVSLGLGAVALLGVGVEGKLRQRVALAETASAQGRPPMVSVVQPHRAATVPAVVLPATVEPMQETTIYARTSGYVKTVHVDIGDRVAAGQLLAEIESPEVDASLREARARLDQERANLLLARATLERTRQLHREQLVSQQQLDEQEAGFDTRQAAVEAAQATVQSLAIQQAYQRVVAPFAGTVTSRRIDRGALITSGSGATVASLFTIGQTDALRVFVDVPQMAAVGIAPGQTVDVGLRERPGHVTSGRVVRTAGALDSRSRTLRTEVHLPNDDHALMPGMYVQVAFPAASGDPALVVPANALVVRTDGSQVAVVEGTAVHYRKVVLGRDFGNEVEVLSGLNGGESLVASPGDRLTDGQIVQVASATGKGD